MNAHCKGGFGGQYHAAGHVGQGSCVRGRERSDYAVRLGALTFSEYWLLNYSAFPLFDLIFIWTREVSACVGGAALAAIAVLSFWRSRPLDGRIFTWGVVSS